MVCRSLLRERPKELYVNKMKESTIKVNGKIFDNQRYMKYHYLRFKKTLKVLQELGSKKVMELGGHPWAMTSMLVDEPNLNICATVSAEEVTFWPDEIPITKKKYEIQTAKGNINSFTNYSANLERSRFTIEEQPDTVLACEIIEHLVRAPHVMLLNMNDWLPVGGKVILTTPNGAQFSNPFRTTSPIPNYRCHLYSRHQYLFTLDTLCDLVKLCGFKILKAGYWDVYPRKGKLKIYDVLGGVPSSYFKAKFKKTLFIIAEKIEDKEFIEDTPLAYERMGNWEYIKSDILKTA